MAQDSWPLSTRNSGTITEAEHELLAARFSDDGIDGAPADSAVVTAGVGLTVTIAANKRGSVRGAFWTSGTTSYTEDINGNASGSTRTDAVVLRLDRMTMLVRTAIREGTPGSGVPALVQDPPGSGVYEILLAYVTVPDSATSVTVVNRPLFIGSRLRPCTSTTRPTLPRPGDMAYETDTDRLIQWTTGGAWKVLHEDSGDIALSGSFNTWEQRDACVGRRVGNVVSLRLSYRRTGITFGSTDADGSRVAILPSTLRPSDRPQYATALFGNGALSTLRVQTDGEVWLETPTKNVEVNKVVRLTVTYLR